MNAAPTLSPSPAGSRHLMTVLLVDDQPIVAEAVRRCLVNLPDLTFRYCADPKTAVAVAEQLRPTVILQDLIMPGVDGLDLLKQYRANPATKDTPVIVLSTKEEPKTKALAFEFGANDYLVKLPDRVELIARVRFQSQYFLNQIERDEAHAALGALNQKLEAADAAKNRFLGMAAHDLRNPLVVIRGFAEFLRDGIAGPLTAEQLDLVATIHASSCGMLKLVNELLDVAVIEAGELKLDAQPHDLAALIEKVMDQGPGIPEKERGKLFKDFGRLSAVPTGGESSTGLGLAICRKIVEAHRDEISAENLPGGGCAFRVTLPA